MHEPPATNGGRPQGQLERALMDLALGSHQGRQERHEALLATRQGEYEQQVQVQVAGAATSVWGYLDIPVTWEHPFVYSPLQRDIQFETPHVASHIEWTSTLTDLVVAHAHVVSWNTNDQGWCIGATVRVAVQAPNTETQVNYQGTVHLTFQGYAFPTDEELNT